MKKRIISLSAIGLLIVLIASCGGQKKNEAEQDSSTPSVETPTEEESTTTTEETSVPNTESYDPKRGEGKFDETNVKLGSINADMATKGEAIASTKCTSCHKTTDEKLVGPGWKGVTSRRQPYWIMNFITNPDPMITKDPEVQAQLELCLVRMPNQGLTDEEARNILEFMRKNDGIK